MSKNKGGMRYVIIKNLIQPHETLSVLAVARNLPAKTNEPETSAKLSAQWRINCLTSEQIPSAAMP
jgi:hypothetical protein